MKIRSVCFPWAHSSWEIAQGLPSCAWSLLRLTILFRRPINWIHLYVDIPGLTRSTCVVTIRTTVAAIYSVLAACLAIYVCHICGALFLSPFTSRTLRFREVVTCQRPLKQHSQASDMKSAWISFFFFGVLWYHWILICFIVPYVCVDARNVRCFQIVKHEMLLNCTSPF